MPCSILEWQSEGFRIWVSDEIFHTGDQYFFANKGFGSHNHIVSGDDDLFVNTHCNRENTHVEFRQDTHTRSVPCTGLKEWIKQKKRHLTTAPYYKSRDKLLLITEPLIKDVFFILHLLSYCLLLLYGHVLLAVFWFKAYNPDQ